MPSASGPHTLAAVLLVAGDKSRQWKEWYAEAIPAAETAYKAYLEGER
ncbi:hypothetical protein ACFQ07_26475 [Actinomadura adrarensis]|uniref:Uncharacterized protein n=1 Tax=Actinomadura adrarensis TaxID=1819600 RepID=A0ABW3CMQ5_9ACTN